VLAVTLHANVVSTAPHNKQNKLRGP
jgi:hypothetical protein